MNEEFKVVCAWCNKVLIDNPGPISHGICKDCRQAYFPQVKKMEEKRK